MTFFDLSIPYVEKAGVTTTDTRNSRESRLRTTARAMELGYTAIAYDRPFKGILSDADRCQIVPFDTQSILKSVEGTSLAAFISSVGLHRDLLGVPRASPFRQYTRITVLVDSAAGASLLNIGNRLLRSYDLVAARPMNQLAFDQACKASEVDIISLDFSQKLSFRLKLAMVQAAIKRGVHFEICYSHLILDGHARRQILSEAKRLGEWTRGKNLIISGSAPSLKEVRGPHDVANLSTIMLGLTMERAKAAISRNCRALVVNALRKKDCYFKEAIKIERILPEEKMDSIGNWFKDWNDWDPISNGIDDLPSLDDMAMLFSATNTHSKLKNTVTCSGSGMPPNTSIVSCSVTPDLDYANGCRSSNELGLNNVDQEASVMVSKPWPHDVNVETEPCSDERSMAIHAFEKPCFVRTAVSGAEQRLTSLGVIIDYGKASNTCMEDAEINNQVDATLAFTEAHTDVPDLLDCSFMGSRGQISMVDNGSVIIQEEHNSEKMVESEENISSSDFQVDGNPDMIEVHTKLVLPLEKMGGKEEVAVQLETSITDDVEVNPELKYQQEPTDAAGSTIVSLLDDSSNLEMQTKASILIKNSYSNGFTTKIKGKRKRVCTTEIPDPGVLSDGPSTAKEEQYFFSENISPLKKAKFKIEGKCIQRPSYPCGVNMARIHKSGKHRRTRGISRHGGYPFFVKDFCKLVLFKMRTGRKGHKLLRG